MISKYPAQKILNNNEFAGEETYLNRLKGPRLIFAYLL